MRKDIQPALPRIGTGPYSPDRDVDVTTAKLLQELREEQEARVRLAAELEAAKARQATIEETVRLLTREKDTAERRCQKLRTLFRKQSARPERISSPAIEQLLRRADDLEAALYDLHSLHAVAQAGGADAGQRIANLQLLGRIRTVVRETVPREATAIVVSKGDPELMKLHGRTAWHFPRAAGNVYAGVYPRSSTAAIAHLETLRAQGGDYLVFPATAFWWLEHYAGFREHLARRYRLVADSKDTCRIYSLRSAAVNDGAATAEAFQALLEDFRARHNRAPSILDWNSGLDLAAGFPEHTVFSPPSGDSVLPYLAGSIDITVLPAGDQGALAEAQRVAQMATVRVSPAARGSGASALAIEWKQSGAGAPPLSTSIVIPCHNHAAETAACLTSLLETLPGTFAGEVIVVDDASTDETPALLKRFAGDKRVRVVRNAKNGGFILSCNRGAKAATGDILLFLNNDTVMLPGWLSPILNVFRDEKKTGVVGGKLLFPDGRLQEAGGLVFRDGSAAHFGRGDYDTDGFLYQFLREVDYCSGAFLATPRALFDELDGFDRHYQPAYYEDVDYCFKARTKGYRVYYQPESAIVHFEGATSGVDPTQGVKRHIVANQRKFAERWKSVLRNYPVRPSHEDTAAWQAAAITTRPGK